MKIYGVAMLALCFLVGKVLGNYLGLLIQIDGDIGGVGFAMILLIFSNSYLKKKGLMQPETAYGILFWSSMYIPIIVAMAATLNVRSAISGGWVAVCAGAVVTLGAFFLVPLIAKIGKEKDEKTPDL